jgi:hypothetical protein
LLLVEREKNNMWRRETETDKRENIDREILETVACTVLLLQKKKLTGSLATL